MLGTQATTPRSPTTCAGPSAASCAGCAQPGPPIGQLAVQSRLDRDGPASISDLAAADRYAPSRWRRRCATSRRRTSLAPPGPGGRPSQLVELTNAGLETLLSPPARGVRTG